MAGWKERQAKAKAGRQGVQRASAARAARSARGARQPGTSVQRHDRSAGPVRDARRDLVPGRGQRGRGEALRPAVENHDHRLAATLGPGRLPVHLRPVAQLHEGPAAALGNGRLAADPRAVLPHALGRAQHGHGRDDRHRRSRRHSSQEQTGSGQAAGSVGTGQDLRQGRGGLRPALPVDA